MTKTRPNAFVQEHASKLLGGVVSKKISKDKQGEDFIELSINDGNLVKAASRLKKNLEAVNSVLELYYLGVQN